MSRELNEAAEKYALKFMIGIPQDQYERDQNESIRESLAQHFLAGAAWQRENFDFLEALAERQVKLTGDPKLKAALEAYRSEHNSDDYKPWKIEPVQPIGGCGHGPHLTCSNCQVGRNALEVSQNVCTCGHTKEQHIYEEGACRPGYVCPVGCERFNAQDEGIK